MSFSKAIVVALFCGALMLAPSLADARAGGGKSMGSRGGSTYQTTPAKPIERSITQPPAVKPGGSTAIAQPSPMGRGMFGGSPFMTGLMGGLLGAGLFGMLFGSSAWAAEGTGGAGMLGMFLQFAMIGGLAYLGVVLFRRFFGAGTPAMAGGQSGIGARPAGFGGAAGYEPAQAEPMPGPAITDADRAAFGVLLMEIQQSWADGDLVKLRRLATPEMLSYFAEDLADASSKGVRNVVKDLALLKGDVVEQWAEGERQYATAVMTWRAVDYVERDGQVVDGDPAAPVEATEAWTFLRSAGGNWILSAIQQI